jgi:alpha-glucan, water dikinase
VSKYWEVLTANGITKERLASYERKITTEPWYKPEATGDFEEYHKILKQMHSSGDLEILSNEAKQHLGNDTKGLIDDLMRNYGDHDTLRQMERVSKLRFNLHQNHMDKNNRSKLKDIMFLDLALEGYLRALTERIIHIDIGFEAYIREVAIILSNLVLSY